MKYNKEKEKFYIDDKLCLSCIKYRAFPEESFIWRFLYEECGRSKSHWIPKKEEKPKVL